jgi:hypothetical protein
MIRFQSQRTKPTRSAAGRQGRIHTIAFAASVTLIAQTLSACSSQPVPATGAVTQYPDLNDPMPGAALRADEVARTKADLIQLRDDQVRAAVQQLAFH